MSVALWGWSTRQERIAWKCIARGYHPDAAVLAVCLNDIPELFNNLSRPPRRPAALHERSALVRVVVNAEAREIDSVERLFSEPQHACVGRATRGFFDEVRTLRREVEPDGAALAVIVFPFRFQVTPDAPSRWCRSASRRSAETEKLRRLDLLPAIASIGAVAFDDYDHLSPAGAVRTAETLASSGPAPAAEPAPAVLERALDARGSVTSSRGPRERPPAPGGAALRAWLSARDEPLPAEAATVSHAPARVGGPGGAPRRGVGGGRGAADGDRRASARARRRAACRRLHVGPRAGGALSRPGAVGSRRELSPPLPSERGRAPRGSACARAGTRTADDIPRTGGGARQPGRLRRGVRGAEPRQPRRAGAGYGSRAREGSRARAHRRRGRRGPWRASDPPPPGVVLVLVEALRSPNADRRFRAARALGRIGPAASDAAGPLSDALVDPSAVVRQHAARALGRIGPAGGPPRRAGPPASHGKTPTRRCAARRARPSSACAERRGPRPACARPFARTTRAAVLRRSPSSWSRVVTALRILALGYLPYDDALRHAAKAVSGRPWSEILLLRPGFDLDSNPGWHAFLARCTGYSASGRWTSCSCRSCSCSSSSPSARSSSCGGRRRCSSLSSANVLDPGNVVRLFSGRPFLLSSAIVPRRSLAEARGAAAVAHARPLRRVRCPRVLGPRQLLPSRAAGAGGGGRRPMAGDGASRRGAGGRRPRRRRADGPPGRPPRADGRARIRVGRGGAHGRRPRQRVPAVRRSRSGGGRVRSPHRVAARPPSRGDRPVARSGRGPDGAVLGPRLRGRALLGRLGPAVADDARRDRDPGRPRVASRREGARVARGARRLGPARRARARRRREPALDAAGRAAVPLAPEPDARAVAARARRRRVLLGDGRLLRDLLREPGRALAVRAGLRAGAR